MTVFSIHPALVEASSISRKTQLAEVIIVILIYILVFLCYK